MGYVQILLPLWSACDYTTTESFKTNCFFSEDMLKVIRATKRKCRDPGNLREGCEKATDTATEGQLGTQSGSHDGRIMKRAADSQVSIISHS